MVNLRRKEKKRREMSQKPVAGKRLGGRAMEVLRKLGKDGSEQTCSLSLPQTCLPQGQVRNIR